MAWCFASLNPKGGDSDQSYHFDTLYRICFFIPQLGQDIVMMTYTYSLNNKGRLADHTKLGVANISLILGGFRCDRGKGIRTTLQQDIRHAYIPLFYLSSTEHTLTDVDIFGFFFN